MLSHVFVRMFRVFLVLYTVFAGLVLPCYVRDPFKSPEPSSLSCEKDCETRFCSKYKHLKWYLQITVEGVSKQTSNCFGTIVGSNLILTSEKCLLQRGTTPEFKEFWIKAFTKNETFSKHLNLENIEIRGSDHENNYRFSFEIQDIIFSQEYSIATLLNSFPEKDAALIVTKENLFVEMEGSRRFRSVCLGEDGITLQNVYAYSFAMTHPKFQRISKRFSWNIHEHCDARGHPINNSFTNAVQQTTSAQSNLMRLIRGRIVPLEKCNEAFFFFGDGAPPDDSEDTICFRYQDEEKMDFMGMPLFVGRNEFETTFSTLCLVAIATGIPNPVRKMGPYYYSYYTNILRMSYKFMWRAKKYGPKTCRKLAESTDEHVETGKAREPYPWETEQGVPERNVSLKCGCGLLTSGKVSRWWENKKYDEDELKDMPWMSLIVIKKTGGMEKCVGALINDRMVIVAAHCLLIDVNPHILRPVDSIKKDFVGPEKISVYLGVDNRAVFMIKKPSKIIIHPGFANHWENDIALIILNERVPFAQCGSGMRPLCLPNRVDDANLKQAVGWTKYGENGEVKESHKLVSNVYQQDLYPCYNFVVDLVQISHSGKLVCANRPDEPNQEPNFPLGESKDILLVNNGPVWSLYGLGVWRTGAVHPDSGKYGTEGVFYNLRFRDGFIDYYAHQEGARWCVEEVDV